MIVALTVSSPNNSTGRVEMKVYTLFDRKVGEYGGLVTGANNETVIRALRDGLPPNSTEAKYPGDFEVCYLGEYDPATGLITGSKEGRPVVLGTIKDLLAPEV